MLPALPGVPGVGDIKFVSHVVTASSPVSNSGLIQVSGSLIVDTTFTNTGFYDGINTNGLVNFGTVTVTTNGVYQNSGLFDNIGGATLTITPINKWCNGCVRNTNQHWRYICSF
jgi:hypothetical protein